MNTNISSTSTRVKVGIFTLTGLVLTFLVTMMVNDRPYWWRACQLVHINVEDATGLKSKSPVRSLGLQIGYISSVQLSETHVDLGICITAPVEVLPSTRAYVRGEGFLGDKFVELKPVKYSGDKSNAGAGREPQSIPQALINFLLPSAHAADPTPGAKPTAGRQIPVGENSQDVQAIVNRVDSLVNEMTGLTNNLKQAINPEELRATMRQLNRTLENASRTLSPEGGLNQTAQRTLAKLEDAIEQLRDQMTRVNQGKGSIGMFLNDPTYAEETREAIRNINRLLSKVGGVRFFMDVGGEKIRGYEGGRGWFKLSIYPAPDRYYLVGISTDPRGRLSTLRTTTQIEGTGISQTVVTKQVEETGILLTGMFGKTFFENRLDLSIGALYGDGAVSGAVNLGPTGSETMVQVRSDIYSRGAGVPIDARVRLSLRPIQSSTFRGAYLMGGIESFRQVGGKVSLAYGAGVTFEDEDIKLLFAFR